MGRDPRSCETGMRRDPRYNAGGLVNSGPPRHVVAREWIARAHVDWTGRSLRRRLIRLQRIYNFLLFHAIILSILDV